MLRRCRYAQGVPALPQGESPSAQGVKEDDEVSSR
jgi:hypothetical protein